MTVQGLRGWLHLHGRHVDGQRQIAGTTGLQRTDDHPINLSRGVVGGKLCRCRTDFCGHANKMLEIAIAQRMMNTIPLQLGLRRRRANDMDHRQILGITARNAINRAELAHTKRGQ